MAVYSDRVQKASYTPAIELSLSTSRAVSYTHLDTAMGSMLKYGSEGAKQFYEMYVLDPVHAKAHTNGDIHIHDLDFLTLTTTCCQIDLGKLFHDGFSTGHGFLREPNDISSYSALACIDVYKRQVGRGSLVCGEQAYS